MDTPTPEQIETFVSITGASGAIAAQKLQEHHGDLNAAVNAYFNEGDRTNTTNQRSQPLPDESEMEIDDPVELPIPRSTFLPAHEEINPFSILNNFPGFRDPMMGPTAHDFFAQGPRVSQPRVSREIPIEVKDDNSHVQVGPSNTGPAIEEVTGNDLPPHYGPEIHPTVIVDDNDDVVNVDGGNNSGRLHHVDPSPSAPIVADVTDYNNDIEEQMIQAAIEASRRDAMGHSEESFDRPAGDSEITRAVSLSMQAAEQEGSLHAQGVALGNSSPDLPEREIRNARRVIVPNGRLPTQKVGPSSSAGQENESDQEETEEVEEEPLVRHRYPTRGASRNVQYVEDLDSSPYSPPPQNARAGRRQIDGHDFPSDEWGGLSNMEHDEAMMLEAAMFGGIPDGAAYRFSYPQFGPGSNNGYPVVAPRAPSPGLTEQRLLREQQDDDYLAALQADREKELKAIQEREAELQRQKLLEEESRRKQLEEEELERKLAAKEASLPQEPSPEDEGAITLLVRMPDGSRHGRRFLKQRQIKFKMFSRVVATFAIILFVFFSISSVSLLPTARAVEILAKSRLERCIRDFESPSKNLKCENKIVLNIAVPSGSSGGEASIVAQLVEVEQNDTQTMQTIRSPPVITINKSAAYALYELTYIRDVAFKPEEFYVKTRKCEPDASSDVVEMCERLRDESGRIIEHTQPICCACGPQRRVPTSCGSIFDKLLKGKPNTAHCLRFPGDWFHVFGIGKRSLGFNVRIEVKKGSSISAVDVGPENRTVISDDNFLRVNLVGDFAGYTSIPSFEDFYLVTPRLNVNAEQPQDLGTDFSRWMLLERVRFTLDGLECNKIGVGYEAYSTQPDFCTSPLWSCLHNQLWDFWEADQNRLSRNQPPQYVVAGRFERINQHPNAGTHSFSIGITEVLNTNLVVELGADDIEFVYQRSPGKIISINIPTFEALTQFGTATVTAKNTGQLEASYSLTFDCMSGVSYMEEQYFIMKPEEVVTRPFYLYPTTDQATKYQCSAILKASDFAEVDRAECQFTTTATVLDNGTQVVVSTEDKKGIKGFFETIKHFWNAMWNGLGDFFTGKACRRKCSSFFNFSCHMQYLCISWIVLFGLFIAILPTVIVLLWLLHQKGLFDPIYDWWEDRFGSGDKNNRYYSKHKKAVKTPQRNHHKHHKHPHQHDHHHHHHHHQHHQHHKNIMPNSPHAHKRKRTDHSGHHLLHKHAEFGTGADHHRSRHDDSLRVHKEGPKHKHRHSRVSPMAHQRVYRERTHEPLLKDEQEVRVVQSRNRLHRDHAHLKYLG